MKKLTVFFIFCVLLNIGLAAPSSGLDITAVSDLLYIESIDAIRIINEPKPALRIIAKFKNSSERTIRIKNGYFEVFINPKMSKPVKDITKQLGGEDELQPIKVLNLGFAKMGAGKTEYSYFISELDFFEINAGEAKSGILEIMLPMDEPKRNIKIHRLINYIGLPGSFESISLIGKVTVGFGGKRGWAYQDLSLLELYYEPKLQNQVLFK